MADLSDQELVDLGKQVLLKESQEIKSCAGRLGQSFAEAVNLVSSCKHRVVTSGLGKSGHIARKLSVTLASIGVPSSFLHPAEALHGDAGSITGSDILIAFGHSGENIETLRLAEFCLAKDVPVIAITGNIQSSLAKKARCTLDAGIECESDPLGVVPTSSSAVGLSIGHGLVVALMHKREVDIQSFARLHPGGTLGAKITMAKEHLENPPGVFVGPQAGLSDVLESMQAKNLGVVGLVEGKQLIGCITDGDIRRAFLRYGSKAFDTALADIATVSPVTCSENDSIWSCIKTMEAKEITSLFMVEEKSKRPLGIIRVSKLRKG